MSLKEIPDKVFVSLGRRGFDPVIPKQCPKCDNSTNLKLIKKLEHDDVEHKEGKKRTIDYKIQCKHCGNVFFVRLQHVLQKINDENKRVTTLVNILDENGNDLGWLGNY